MNEEKNNHLSAQAEKLLADICYLTDRDRSFPDAKTLKKDYSLSTSKLLALKKELVAANLIKVTGGHNPYFIPSLNIPENLTERWQINSKMISIIQAVYFFCNENGSLPDVKSIISMTGFFATDVYRELVRLKELKIINIVNIYRVKEHSIEPVICSPVMSPEPYLHDNDQGLNAPPMYQKFDSRISSLQADIVQAIYNFSHELGYVPDFNLLSEKSGMSKSSLHGNGVLLEKNGIIFRDKSERPFTFYLLQGNGCDDISAPLSAMKYERITASDADVVNLIHNTSQALGHKPTIKDLAAYADMKDNSYVLLPVLRRLEKNGIISFEGKKPKLFYINVTASTAENVSLKRANIKLPERITAGQADALNYIRHHILTYGYSPSNRDIVASIGVSNTKCLEALVQRGLLYLDENSSLYRFRISRGIGMDDIPTDLPILNEMHHRVYAAIIDDIRRNMGNANLSVNEMVCTRDKNCFTKTDIISSCLDMSTHELKKYLYALRTKGCLFESRKNRYGLPAEYITVAKDIMEVDAIGVNT